MRLKSSIPLAIGTSALGSVLENVRVVPVVVAGLAAARRAGTRAVRSAVGRCRDGRPEPAIGDTVANQFAQLIAASG